MNKDDTKALLDEIDDFLFMYGVTSSPSIVDVRDLLKQARKHLAKSLTLEEVLEVVRQSKHCDFCGGDDLVSQSQLMQELRDKFTKETT